MNQRNSELNMNIAIFEVKELLHILIFIVPTPICQIKYSDEQ